MALRSSVLLRRLSVVLPVALSAALLVGGTPPTAGAAAAGDLEQVSAADVREAARRVRTPVRRRLVDRVRFGAWVDGMTLAPEKLAAFEELVQEPTSVASLYWGYGDWWPGRVEESFARGGTRDVLLSWDMGPTRFAEWTRGEHDDYLDVLVGQAKAYPYTVHVRPWPEMNGDWQDFQPTPSGGKRYGGTPAEFVAAWRHVVDHFRDRGVTNVKWVFNPTTDTYAGTTPVESIWPGAAYVDVLGLDGFNWGRDASWGTWQSFTTIFAAQYKRLTALHPTAPVWVCEVGSKEPTLSDGAPVDPTASKGAWVKEMFTTRRFPRISTVIWFQERKERDWRAESSAASLAAFRRYL